MADSRRITRRAAIAGAAVSTVALAPPVASAARPIYRAKVDPLDRVNEALTEFRDALMEYDQTVKGIWLQHNFDGAPGHQYLDRIVIDRSRGDILQAKAVRRT